MFFILKLDCFILEVLCIINFFGLKYNYDMFIVLEKVFI